MIQRDNILMPDLCHRHYPMHFATALHLLRKMGIAPERIDIVAVGTYQNYRGEIQEQNPKAGTAIDRDTRISLRIGHKSAVDLMPYQFFYGLRGITDRADNFEEQARKLMAPFDAALIRRLATAAFETLKFNFGFLDVDQIGSFLKLFDFEQYDRRSNDETLLWLSLMPAFNLWAGNPEMVARILGLVFRLRFRIIENTAIRNEIPSNLRYRLGSRVDRLGRGTIAGREFIEHDTGYTVIIKNVPPERIAALRPGQTERKKLEQLLELCMPGNLTFKIKIKAVRTGCELGKDRPVGYLGYSSFL